MINRVDPSNPHLGGNIVGPNGDVNTFYPELWKWLVHQYNVKSVLDVGCGSGHSSVEFSKLGCNVVGIDGLIDNIKDLSAAGVPGLLHDYTKGPAILSRMSFDLCWCCEFVEHVEEKYLSNILSTFTASTVVAITHGLPGQGGYHHVNLQWPLYWQAAMLQIGYELDVQASLTSRSKAGGYWANTGLIFKRSTHD